MPVLARIPYARVDLRWHEDLPGAAESRAKQMRGALAQAFADDDLFHQHDAEGKPLYRYPYVQYRWQGGQGVVVGWWEAANRLLQLPWLDLPLRLGNDEVCVTDATLTANYGSFELSERLHHYQIISPMLLFNQQNYRRYQVMNEGEQQAERDRLLVAQLLIAMRGLQVEFPVNLYATFTHVRGRVAHYKQQDLIGITGRFVCNAALPPDLAIGHAVSHGYGWIIPAPPQEVR